MLAWLRKVLAQRLIDANRFHSAQQRDFQIERRPASHTHSVRGVVRTTEVGTLLMRWERARFCRRISTWKSIAGKGTAQMPIEQHDLTARVDRHTLKEAAYLAKQPRCPTPCWCRGRLARSNKSERSGRDAREPTRQPGHCGPSPGFIRGT